MREWADDKDAAFNPAFFDDAHAVELPEVSWREVESIADGVELLPPAGETEEQELQREAAEREHLRRQKLYSELDGQLRDVDESDDLFAVTAKMSASIKAFNTVASTYVSLRNSSFGGVMKYTDASKRARKPATPIKADFFADVQIVGARALKDSPADLRTFLHHIIECEGEGWEAIPLKVRGKISETVGKAFMRAKLYPTVGYFS